MDLQVIQTLIGGYKINAKKRNIKYDITEEQFAEITQKDCFYCGVKPSNVSKKKLSNGDYIYNGIDRVDNSKGYEIDNIVPCCRICNVAKNTLTLSEFKNWIKRSYNKMYGVN